MQKSNKRKYLIGALAVLLVAVVVGGTVAWLTAEDQATNTFTVGSFQDPGKDPETDDGNDEDKDESETANVGGYLFETAWPLDENGETKEGEEPKLMPGVATPKNPNVGIGAGSDDAYVFLYVVNDSLEEGGDLASQAPYFTIQKQWMPVTAEGVTPTSATAGGEDAYVDGLFMYVEDNSSDPTSPVPLAAPTADGVTSSYTGELFEDITMPNGVDTRVYKTSDGNIKVYAFIYGADAEAESGDGTAAQALADAINWAKGL